GQQPFIRVRLVEQRQVFEVFAAGRRNLRNDGKQAGRGARAGGLDQQLDRQKGVLRQRVCAVFITRHAEDLRTVAEQHLGLGLGGDDRVAQEVSRRREVPRVGPQRIPVDRCFRK